ncbi:hypothetical protein LTR62_007196 [Meristemomyces frigidus]|uniref:RING-type domain-containing protein n=1 Tax=Meristemomyces frigidus TaxID=1508187 RepID=A0AAN7YDR0_9PEZI|nr:hypothetical protein LTR62_007196 [Meristemomyces frigidus]
MSTVSESSSLNNNDNKKPALSAFLSTLNAARRALVTEGGDPDDCMVCTEPWTELHCSVGDQRTDPFHLACGHLICCECAKQWFGQPSDSCPMCRCVLLTIDKKARQDETSLQVNLSNDEAIAAVMSMVLGSSSEHGGLAGLFEPAAELLFHQSDEWSGSEEHEPVHGVIWATIREGVRREGETLFDTDDESDGEEDEEVTAGSAGYLYPVGGVPLHL